jgi:hypothetical protein
MNDYIIQADYGSIPYYIGEDNGRIFMDKLRTYDIVKDDFGYTLEEAKTIMKKYKSYTKKKQKEYMNYLKEFDKASLERPLYHQPYIAKKIFLRKKSKIIKNEIEEIRYPNGEYGYKFK